MKRLLSNITKLLPLLAAIVLVGILAFVLSRAQPATTVVPGQNNGQTQQSVAAGTAGDLSTMPPTVGSTSDSSAYPPPDGTPSNGNGGQPTPLPNQGVEAGPASELDLTKGPVSIAQLYSASVVDNSLVGVAKDTDGNGTVVKVALDTGAVENTGVQSKGGFEWVGLSGSDVVWLDLTTNDNLHSRHFSVTDLQKPDQGTWQIGNGTIRRPDLKNGILVWEELRNGTWGVSGYDLVSNKSLDLTQAEAFAPYVCSDNWVIYLDNRNIQTPPLGSADLHAHNIVTNQDILIGQVPMPRDLPVPHQIACDGNRVAWINVQAKELESTDTNSDTGQSLTITTTIPVSSVHVYNLEKGTDQVLNGLGQGFAQIFIKGDIVASTNGYVGYDLQRNVPFSLSPSPDFLGSLSAGITLLFGNDQLVWLSGGLHSLPQHLYSSPILRSP